MIFGIKTTVNDHNHGYNNKVYGGVPQQEQLQSNQGNSRTDGGIYQDIFQVDPPKPFEYKQNY